MGARTCSLREGPREEHGDSGKCVLEPVTSGGWVRRWLPHGCGRLRGSRRLWAARGLAYVEIYSRFTLVDSGEVTWARTEVTMQSGRGASQKEGLGAPGKGWGRKGGGEEVRLGCRPPTPTRKCLSNTSDPTGAPLPGPGGGVGVGGIPVRRMLWGWGRGLLELLALRWGQQEG